MRSALDFLCGHRRRCQPPVNNECYSLSFLGIFEWRRYCLDECVDIELDQVDHTKDKVKVANGDTANTVAIQKLAVDALGTTAPMQQQWPLLSATSLPTNAFVLGVKAQECEKIDFHLLDFFNDS